MGENLKSESLLCMACKYVGHFDFGGREIEISTAAVANHKISADKVREAIQLFEVLLIQGHLATRTAEELVWWDTIFH